jgi:hypothetical protein
MSTPPKKKKNPLADLVPCLKPIILATQEVEIGRILVQGQPQQNVHETPSQLQLLSVVVHACHPSYTRKHK